MKKTSSLLIVAIFILTTAFSSKAQNIDITMEPILNAAEPWVQYLEGELEQEIVRMEFDIITSSKDTFRSLSSNWNYGILAFGDFRIKDIDIRLYKWEYDEWRLVEKDNSNDSSAFIYIKPNEDGNYKITIKAYSFEEGYRAGHYGLIIFHEAP